MTRSQPALPRVASDRFFDLRGAERHESGVARQVSAPVDVQFRQIAGESMKECKKWNPRICGQSHKPCACPYDATLRQLRDLADLQETFQSTKAEKQRKPVRRQERLNDIARESARHSSFEAARTLKIQGKVGTVKRMARRETGLRQSIYRQRDELVLGYQEEARGVITEFDRKERELGHRFTLKKSAVDREFTSAVQALKRRAAAKCQVLETDRESIDRFVSQIMASIDDSANACVRSREDALEDRQKEAMRAKALEVTRSILEDPRENAEQALRKTVQTSIGRRVIGRPTFQTQPHVTFSDRHTKL
jgi:hypothetical protein